MAPGFLPINIPVQLRCEHVLSGKPCSCYEWLPTNRGYWKCTNKDCRGHLVKCEDECFLGGYHLRSGERYERWCAVRKTAMYALPEAGHSALELIVDFWPVRKMNDKKIYEVLRFYQPYGEPEIDMFAAHLLYDQFRTRIKGPVMTDIDYAERTVHQYISSNREADLWSYDTS